MNGLEFTFLFFGFTFCIEMAYHELISSKKTEKEKSRRHNTND